MSDLISESAIPVAQKAVSFGSYFVSGGLIVGDAINYLDNHTGAFGVLLGGCTVLINWWYQHKRFKADLQVAQSNREKL